MTPTGAQSESSKTERVYRHLRRRIRELALAPGAPLRKEEIAAELGVSREPVSAALARLADEALVDVFPQHGSFVAPIRAEDVRESLFVRTALEAEAARRVAQGADGAMMAGLALNLEAQEAALAEGDLDAFRDLDEALHAAIVSAVAAPRAQRLLEAAWATLERPRRLVPPDEDRLRASLAEHRRLVEAIRSEDPEFAAAAMRAHLSMVAMAMERALAEIHAKDGDY